MGAPDPSSHWAYRIGIAMFKEAHAQAAAREAEAQAAEATKNQPSPKRRKVKVELGPSELEAKPAAGEVTEAGAEQVRRLQEQEGGLASYLLIHAPHPKKIKIKN